MIHTLSSLVRASSPNEAVGLIVRDHIVLELTNASDQPESSFAVGVDDIIKAVDEANLSMTEADWEGIILWHSHPGGGIGPSRVDMRNRVPRWSHLVLTIDGDDIIPTWY